jgi:hypothetical protein
VVLVDLVDRQEREVPVRLVRVVLGEQLVQRLEVLQVRPGEGGQPGLVVLRVRRVLGQVEPDRGRGQPAVGRVDHVDPAVRVGVLGEQREEVAHHPDPVLQRRDQVGVGVQVVERHRDELTDGRDLRLGGLPDLHGLARISGHGRPPRSWPP